ncbi:hypothetical protein AUP68_02784 [Ilyonectria robusta]
MYYSTSFFDGAGVESPYTKSLIINVINVVSTLPGLLVIEHWGRRRLLMIGALGMAACQLLMASFNTATGDDMKKISQTILVTFCSVNIFFFAASWGPVVWVVTSEIYPLKVRAKAMSVSTASNWVLNFAIAYSSPFMLGDGPGGAAFGPKIFFIWGAFCILAVFFVWCMVYETSKISLEQIDEMYERVNHAWNSKAFQPRICYAVDDWESGYPRGQRLIVGEEVWRLVDAWATNFRVTDMPCHAIVSEYLFKKYTAFLNTPEHVLLLITCLNVFMLNHNPAVK